MAFGDRKGTLEATNASIPNPFASSGSVVVAVGDLILTGISQQTNLTATTASDNLGNTHTAINAGTDAGNVSGKAYYSYVTVAGTLTGVSLVTTSSANDATIGSVVVEGPFNSAPLDANPANSTDAATPFTCTTTGTLGQADEYIAAFAMSGGSVDDWVCTSPNIQQLKATPVSTSAKLQIGGQVVAATTAVAPAFTGTNPTVAVLICASFKKAAAGGASVVPILMSQYRRRWDQ